MGAAIITALLSEFFAKIIFTMKIFLAYKSRGMYYGTLPVISMQKF